MEVVWHLFVELFIGSRAFCIRTNIPVSKMKGLLKISIFPSTDDSEGTKSDLVILMGKINNI